VIVLYANLKFMEEHGSTYLLQESVANNPNNIGDDFVDRIF